MTNNKDVVVVLEENRNNIITKATNDNEEDEKSTDDDTIINIDVFVVECTGVDVGIDARSFLRDDLGLANVVVMTDMYVMPSLCVVLLISVQIANKAKSNIVQGECSIYLSTYGLFTKREEMRLFLIK
jgi:hypothetical protein